MREIRTQNTFCRPTTREICSQISRCRTEIGDFGLESSHFSIAKGEMSLDSFRFNIEKGENISENYCFNIEKGEMSSDFSRDNIVMAWFLSAFAIKKSIFGGFWRNFNPILSHTTYLIVLSLLQSTYISLLFLISDKTGKAMKVVHFSTSFTVKSELVFFFTSLIICACLIFIPLI
jgi:hypothetical protein